MRPDRALVSFDGIDHELDVMACRQALVRRRVEGRFRSLESLAEAVGCSRSTVSRFFGGRQTSLGVALTILEQLQLTFDDVYTRCVIDGRRGPAEDRSQC